MEVAATDSVPAPAALPPASSKPEDAVLSQWFSRITSTIPDWLGPVSPFSTTSEDVPLTPSDPGEAPTAKVLGLEKPANGPVRRVTVAGHTKSHSSTTIDSMKRSTRSKTHYRIAHPPQDVTPRRKLTRVPRLAFQLHLLSSDGQSAPAYDVNPIASLTRELRKTLASSASFKPPLGDLDLAVLTSEHCRASHAEHSASCATRNPVGVVSEVQAGNEPTYRISLLDSKTWIVRRLRNGSYEISDRPDQTPVYKWNPQRVRSGLVSPKPTALAAHERPRGKKYQFIKVIAQDKSHPILASLDEEKMSICDHFPSSYPTSSRPAVKRSVSVDMSVQKLPTVTEADDIEVPEKVEGDLRQLILVTGISVVLAEGWSRRYGNADIIEPLNLSSLPGSPMYPAEPKLSPSGSPLPESRASSPSSMLEDSRSPTFDPLGNQGGGESPLKRNRSERSMSLRLQLGRTLSGSFNHQRSPLLSPAVTKEDTEQAPQDHDANGPHQLRLSTPPDKDTATNSQPSISRDKIGSYSTMSTAKIDVTLEADHREQVDGSEDVKGSVNHRKRSGRYKMRSIVRAVTLGLCFR